MSSSDSIFVLMLLAGLAGGLGHCSSMCGPLVILLSPGQAGKAHKLHLHVRLNAGRILSYALIGGVLALLTSLLALEIDSFPARRLAMLIAGAVLLFSGLSTLGLPLLRRGWLLTACGAPLRRVTSLARSAGPFSLGLLWGFLPCGLLYSAYAAAVGAGATASQPLAGAVAGATVMLLFALGTTPTLLGIGWAAEQLPVNIRTWLQRIAGAIVAVSGILLILSAL